MSMINSNPQSEPGFLWNKEVTKALFALWLVSRCPHGKIISM